MSNLEFARQLNLNEVHAFTVIAQSQSLTEAARALELDKSRVSRILTSLEAALKVELISRSSRHFRLTASGQQLLEASRSHFSALEEALQDLARGPAEPEGHLKMTVAHGLATEAVPGILSEFMTLYPKVSVELIVSQDLIDLPKAGIDLAVRVGPLPDSALKSRRAGRARMILSAAPAFLRHAGPITHPRDVTALPRVGLSAFSRRGVELRSDAGEKFHLAGDYHFHSNSPTVAVALCCGGQGVGLLPEALCRAALLSGELRPVLPSWAGPSFVFNIVHRYRGEPPPHVRKLSDFLNARLSTLLQYG